MKIHSAGIAIIMQGNIGSNIIECLANIRRKLPHAYIILSTWKGNEVEGLNVDKVIFSIDPGAEMHEGKPYNINRMILSTRAGINYIIQYMPQIKYILKLRSDMWISHLGFLRYYNKFPKRYSAFSLFNKRIVAYPLYSLEIDSRIQKGKIKNMELPFHVSDWCYFGLKEDLKELFNIPFVKEPEFTEYFKTHVKPKNDIFPQRTWKMPPEQYITNLNAKKKFVFDFDNYADLNESNYHISKDFIYNNFIFLDVGQHGCLNVHTHYYKFLFENIPYNNCYNFKKFNEYYYKKLNIKHKIMLFYNKFWNWNIFKYRIGKKNEFKII